MVGGSESPRSVPVTNTADVASAFVNRVKTNSVRNAARFTAATTTSARHPKNHTEAATTGASAYSTRRIGGCHATRGFIAADHRRAPGRRQRTVDLGRSPVYIARPGSPCPMPRVARFALKFDARPRAAALGLPPRAAPVRRDRGAEAHGHHAPHAAAPRCLGRSSTLSFGSAWATSGSSPSRPRSPRSPSGSAGSSSPTDCAARDARSPSGWNASSSTETTCAQPATPPSAQRRTLHEAPQALDALLVRRQPRRRPVRPRGHGPPVFPRGVRHHLPCPVRAPRRLHGGARRRPGLLGPDAPRGRPRSVESRLRRPFGP